MQKTTTAAELEPRKSEKKSAQKATAAAATPKRKSSKSLFVVDDSAAVAAPPPPAEQIKEETVVEAVAADEIVKNVTTLKEPTNEDCEETKPLAAPRLLSSIDLTDSPIPTQTPSVVVQTDIKTIVAEIKTPRTRLVRQSGLFSDANDQIDLTACPETPSSPATKFCPVLNETFSPEPPVVVLNETFSPAERRRESQPVDTPPIRTPPVATPPIRTPPFATAAAATTAQTEEPSVAYAQSTENATIKTSQPTSARKSISAVSITPATRIIQSRQNAAAATTPKTPSSVSVKRLAGKQTGDRLLSIRNQTPFRAGGGNAAGRNGFSSGAATSSSAFSRVINGTTPAKQLIARALPLTKLKSIRKRSMSVDEAGKRERPRVTFHSPANQEIPIDEIDMIMERSVRKENNRQHEENRLALRQRSISNAEGGRQLLRDLNGIEPATGDSAAINGKSGIFLKSRYPIVHLDGRHIFFYLFV